MRLQMLRTARPAEAGAEWMVMDEDAPGAQAYNPVFAGTILDCGRYVMAAETGRTECPRCRNMVAARIVEGVGGQNAIRISTHRVARNSTEVCKEEGN